MNPAPDSQSLKAGQIQARAHQRSLDLEHNSFLGALPLLRLDAELQAEESQSPRPFLHPMRTLGGMLASDFAPPDHAWHHGLSMTCAALKRGGETFNFWGGPTFERGQGYVLRPNHGRQESASRAIPFSIMAGHSALIRQRLRWIVGEEVLIEEERTLQVLVLPHERAWSLIWSSSLKNVCGQALLWGSPTTEGRDNAGYGGLFWRGPRGLKQSQVAFVPRDASPSTCSWLSRDEDIMGRPMQSGEDLLFRARRGGLVHPGLRSDVGGRC